MPVFHGFSHYFQPRKTRYANQKLAFWQPEGHRFKSVILHWRLSLEIPVLAALGTISCMGYWNLSNIVITMFGKGRYTHAKITKSTAEEVPGQKSVLFLAQRGADLPRSLGVPGSRPVLQAVHCRLARKSHTATGKEQRNRRRDGVGTLRRFSTASRASNEE
jgi:hypothetical protein